MQVDTLGALPYQSAYQQRRQSHNLIRITFIVSCPNTHVGQVLRLVGSFAELGNPIESYGRQVEPPTQHSSANLSPAIPQVEGNCGSEPQREKHTRIQIHNSHLE